MENNKQSYNNYVSDSDSESESEDDHNNMTEDGLIIEDLTDDLDVFRVLQFLINNNYTDYIPYRSYNIDGNKLFVHRINLDNNSRLILNNMTNIPYRNIHKLIYRELQWLNNVLWKNYIIHGDLTNDNIIYQNDKFYFIDWEHASIVNNTSCGLFYIFADIIDFLNVFFIKFNSDFINSYQITETDFNKYYNLIKTQESIMKNHENNKQCNEVFNTNFEVLSNFALFIKYWFGIDYTNLFNKRGGKKTKQKFKKRRATRTKRRTTKQKRKTY